MKDKKVAPSRLALKVSLISVGMIFDVYVFMQILGYFRDNAVLGIASVSDLPGYVFNFILFYVVPPAVVFGLVLYFAARPFESALNRLRSDSSLGEEETERLRVSLLRFSWIVLFLNLFGFAMGYAILVLIEDGIGGFTSPFRLIILVSNIAGAAMYASAQSALHDICFGELRDRLGITGLGNRKRAMRSTSKQVLHVAIVAVYAATYLQFNMHGLIAYQDLSFQALRSEASGEARAEDVLRAGIVKAVPGVTARKSFTPQDVPLPWDALADYETRETAVFLLTAFFLAVVCILVQGARSLEMKGQISALNERLLDVIEGGGDLTKRLSLRSMDEFGQLADSVNRLMDRFRSLIYRIGAAAAETREAAQSIDSVMKGSETATMNVIESVVSLSSSIDKQATESRILKDSLESLRAAARAVAGAVDSQRRFTDETASAMEEMSANIRSVESMTHRSGAVTSDLAAKGNSGNSSVHEAAKAIKDIEKSAADVLKVLGSLSRIAGDTNLLAMNAAIEAAHAGTSGAGFAVVAGEVRSLAASAAKETKKIKDLVLEMDGRVHKGVASSEATSQAFLSLSGGIAEAASISAEIASAMKEQSAGTSSVESSINQVQENSRIVRERMEIQERETTLMASGLEETLSRFSSIASSAKAQADAMQGLQQAFSAVRREVDRNLDASGALEKELLGYKV